MWVTATVASKLSTACHHPAGTYMLHACRVDRAGVEVRVRLGGAAQGPAGSSSGQATARERQPICPNTFRRVFLDTAGGRRHAAATGPDKQLSRLAAAATARSSSRGSRLPWPLNDIYGLGPRPVGCLRARPHVSEPAGGLPLHPGGLDEVPGGAWWEQHPPLVPCRQTSALKATVRSGWLAEWVAGGQAEH